MAIEHILDKLKSGARKAGYTSFLMLVGLGGVYLIKQNYENSVKIEEGIAKISIGLRESSKSLANINNILDNVDNTLRDLGSSGQILDEPLKKLQELYPRGLYPSPPMPNSHPIPNFPGWYFMPIPPPTGEEKIEPIPPYSGGARLIPLKR